MKSYFVILFQLFLASALFGQMLPIQDQQLIQSSEDIVRGKVLSSEAKWVNNDKYIYTFTKLKVSENISGHYRKGDIVTIVAPGGYDSVKDIGMRVSHQALFDYGEDVVVFLVKAKGEIDAIDYSFLGKDQQLPKNIMRVNGYFQGKRKIFDDPVSHKTMILKPNEDRSVELNEHQLELKKTLKQIHSNKLTD